VSSPLRRHGATRDVTNAIDGADRRATKLLNEKRHGLPGTRLAADGLVVNAVKSPRVASYTAYLLETFVTLGVVCALAVVVLWVARRAGVVRGSGPIELYGHLPLDARRAIYLVKVGTQVFIVGVGEGGFTKLGEIPSKDLPAVGATRAAPFREVLARALGRKFSGAELDEGEGEDRDPQVRSA
jgi:flagellar biogenesis protein FliO